MTHRSAGELFRSGEEAYAERRFRDAASAFDEANRRAPRGATAYAAGVSWHEAGEPARAADALALALATGGLDDESRVDARTRLGRLSPLLATVTVDGPPGARVTLAHVTGAAVPLKIHLAPGRHFAKRADVAGAPSIKLVVAAGEPARVVLTDASVIEDDPPPPSSVARTAGWVGLAAAGVFSASAVVLGLATLNARRLLRLGEHRCVIARSRADVPDDDQRCMGRRGGLRCRRDHVARPLTTREHREGPARRHGASLHDPVPLKTRNSPCRIA